MNKTKSSNPVRLIAFFLTALLLVCTFGFTADGWHIGDNGSEDIADKDDPPDDLADENSGQQGSEESENPSADKEPEVYIPSYINRLTGLEVNESRAAGCHYAFVLEGGLPYFGISACDIFCQIPTEDGSIRSIAFIHESERLWKIGSIAKTRGYLSNIAKYFGGICISAGDEDEMSYNQCDISSSHLDLSLNSRYYYTEFQSRIYTNSELLASGFSDNKINTEITESSLPYDFIEYGSEPIVYGEEARTVRLSRSEADLTELIYNEESGKYQIYEGGSPLTDSMNGGQVEFVNCFVLFANSVIYDNSECSQMVMDTIGRGVGYYFSGGGYTEIEWSASADGEMVFTLRDGERLLVNRGNIFITFQRSSLRDKIIIK